MVIKIFPSGLEPTARHRHHEQKKKKKAKPLLKAAAALTPRWLYRCSRCVLFSNIPHILSTLLCMIYQTTGMKYAWRQPCLFHVIEYSLLHHLSSPLVSCHETTKRPALAIPWAWLLAWLAGTSSIPWATGNSINTNHGTYIWVIIS